MNKKETPTELKRKIKTLTEELTGLRWELEQVYIPILESTNEFLIMVDRECRYLFVTRNMALHVGLPSHEIIGKKHSDLHKTEPEASRIFAEKVAKVFATGTPVQDEHVSLYSKKYLLRTFFPIKAQMPDGDVTRVAVIGHDITWRKKAEEALRISEESYRNLVENSNDFICTHDLEGNLLSINRAAEQLMRLDRKGIIGKNFRELLDPRFREGFADYLSTISSEGTARGLLTIVTGEGEKRVLEYNNHLSISNTTAPLVQGVARDVTERILAEQKLKKTLSLMHATLESAAAGILAVDNIGNIVTCNSRFAEIWQIPAEVIDARDIDKVMSIVGNQVADKESFLTKRRELMKHPDIEISDELLLKDGRIVERTSRPQKDDKGKTVGRVLSFIDITNRKKMEKDIREMAYHDFLTGLPNRFLFNDRLNVALAHLKRNPEKIALMTIDLDRFKGINDTLGHHTGDMLLRNVGKRLAELIRESDTAARIGGDEFMLLLLSINGERDAVIVARKILDAFRQPFDCEGHQLHITPSIGIAICPDHGADAVTIMKHSDRAMYRVKERGRNNYHLWSTY